MHIVRMGVMNAVTHPRLRVYPKNWLFRGTACAPTFPKRAGGRHSASPAGGDQGGRISGCPESKAAPRAPEINTRVIESIAKLIRDATRRPSYAPPAESRTMPAAAFLHANANV